MSKVFLDTNVLVYSADRRDPVKQARAKQLLAGLQAGDPTPIISTQVLQEFYNALTHKLAVAPALAVAELKVLAEVQTVLLTPIIIVDAALPHGSASVSFWDALIVAAAQSAGCDEIWTEDMQAGRMFGNLKVVNPFAGK